MANFYSEDSNRATSRTRDLSKLLKQYPELMTCYRLLMQHPWAAKMAARAILRITGYDAKRGEQEAAPNPSNSNLRKLE